jgi:hypothetical protein
MKRPLKLLVAALWLAIVCASSPAVGGNFEAIVLEGQNLVHYWRDRDNPGVWHRGSTITSIASGPGSLIQSSFRARPDVPGNLEVVVLEGRNLVHYWRDSVNPGSWHRGDVVTRNATGPGSLWESGFCSEPDAHCNLEVVVLEGRDLVHYWRDLAGLGPWRRGGVITTRATGPGAAIESTFGAAEYTVMSLNARIPNDRDDNAWSARLPRLAATILRFDDGRGAHLIGVQELRRQTRDELHAALDEATGDNYEVHSVDRGDGEMIAIFHRKDRFTVVEQAFRNVSNGERNGECGLFNDEDGRNRPIQFVKVRDRLSDRLTYFYNTHYPSQNSCERRGMSPIVRDFIDDRSDREAPVILVGDLNDGIEPDGRLNRSFEILLNETGFHSAYGLHHALDSTSAFRTGNSWDKIARRGRMIDHVLVSRPSISVAADVDRTMFTSEGIAVACDIVTNGSCANGMSARDLNLYSDHWAVWATIRQ